MPLTLPLQKGNVCFVFQYVDLWKAKPKRKRKVTTIVKVIMEPSAFISLNIKNGIDLKRFLSNQFFFLFVLFYVRVKIRQSMADQPYWNTVNCLYCVCYLKAPAKFMVSSFILTQLKTLFFVNQLIIVQAHHNSHLCASTFWGLIAALYVISSQAYNMISEIKESSCPKTT